MEIIDSKTKTVTPINSVSDKHLEIESLILEMEGTKLRAEDIDTTSLVTSILFMEVEGKKGHF